MQFSFAFVRFGIEYVTVEFFELGFLELHRACIRLIDGLIWVCLIGNCLDPLQVHIWLYLGLVMQCQLDFKLLVADLIGDR